jgi:hypothetical protein
MNKEEKERKKRKKKKETLVSKRKLEVEQFKKVSS